MYSLLLIAFFLGYAIIALEHPVKVNKSATALVLASILWILLATGGTVILTDNAALKEYLVSNPAGSYQSWLAGEVLLKHLGGIAEIIFFLIGAMTIVELVDSHEGFRILTDRVRTTRKTRLLWLVSLITFCLSAILDNLTTAIVMIALIRKLIGDKHERWIFAGMVVIAANSGGAFSPIGDVTTIMLWIGGMITPVNILVKTFLPSLVSLIVPLALISVTLKGEVTRPIRLAGSNGAKTSAMERILVLILGLSALLMVPLFRSLTGLPPYLGILTGLGILWVVTEILHKERNEEDRPKLTVAGVLRRIDTPSILFFLGILLAVAALETAGILQLMATWLDHYVGNLYLVNLIIGLLSAVVDNVPLVAGAMGMYREVYPIDHNFWEMLAYCAGTGGSILIIGSAAGVAVMGMEKMNFIWYLKKMSLPALAGYLAGAACYWALNAW